MALDEYIFGKFASFFKKKKKKAQSSQDKIIHLDEIKNRLLIFARAITGESIDIYPAEKEGGYSNNNFFLPEYIDILSSYEQNASFYLYRVLYLSVQKNLGINWPHQQDYTLENSREKALESSRNILKNLFEEFPIAKEIHDMATEVLDQSSSPKKPVEYFWLYGKWMKNNPNSDTGNQLKNFNEKGKKAIEEEIKTILKAKPVEEIISLEIDKKQQEDYVLTHNFEKVDTAEEYDGGWRDFDGDDDLESHSNALEDLNMKYSVRVDDAVHSVYQAEFMENTTVSESAEIETKDYFIPYDEWDFAKRKYKENYCKVYPYSPTDTDSSYYRKTLRENASTLLGLRKMLTNVNNKLQQQRRQPQGDEFDLDALTDLFVDVHTGHTPSDKIYLSNRKKEKNLSILMLLDISLSSDGYAAGNKVIDVEKQVSIIFGEILNEFNVDFSINCFFSKTRNHSSYITVKDFDEKWDKAKHKIGAVAPEAYTRIGAALRHSGALLDKRSTKNKWVILISDGKPNDYDKYEGKYGINDVKQALRELNQKHINSYALAIEAQAKYYLPQMFGANHYQILTTPVELLQSLVKLYEKIKHQS